MPIKGEGDLSPEIDVLVRSGDLTLNANIRKLVAGWTTGGRPVTLQVIKLKSAEYVVK